VNCGFTVQSNPSFRNRSILDSHLSRFGPSFRTFKCYAVVIDIATPYDGFAENGFDYNRLKFNSPSAISCGSTANIAYLPHSANPSYGVRTSVAGVQSAMAVE
jgi:hypothetical protein